ncbi:DeoR/GlpR family DNA-binding transcription regulator [Fulvivirgaceae bacterium BMA12]|uniref:DeoR/GlpR family DNA-binding transcription regulator n=1 Tax=Agaribacillus aureus TaxID=3051825 RepID=A0ABT8L2T5_9BACT|nr:DeoR/GlpR family DNA-binding transcription regulator [Fulvivirgaceae bacterium BMA12]
MQKDKRQNSILEKLNTDQKVTTLQLAEDFRVSEDTIRRDLNEMAQKGLLSKVHGGAVSSIQKLYYYNDNVIKNQQEKESIAKKATSFLSDDMSIIISDGTTNLAFARNIPKDIKATVFTYCLPIAMELTEHPGIEIIFLGGKIEKKSMVAIGIDVLNKFSDIHVDMCFLGTGSIGPIEGITEGSYEVSLIKKAIIAASDSVISLATSNKLGLRQPYSICKPPEIGFLVTELDPANPKLAHYAEAGIQLL